MDQVRLSVAEANEDALFADGFDEAIIGHVRVFGKPPLALYDYAKCVEVLVKRDGMSEDDAEEFLEFNTLGAYMGENTPAFAVLNKP